MLLIGSLLLGLVVTSSATTWMPLDCDVSGGEMNCEVNLGRNFELGRKARVELKYPRASGAIQQLSFFNEDGGLEYYVRFWDKDTQKIRIGSDLEECHYTRDIPVESRVTGDMIRVVIEANKLASWLSINGKDPVIGPGNMHLRPFARDLCEKRPRDFAKMTFSRNVRNPDPIQFRVKSLRRGWPCEKAKAKLEMCREEGYAIGDCKVGNGELSNKKRRKCEMMESKYGEKCGDYETMWCEIVKPAWKPIRRGTKFSFGDDLDMPTVEVKTDSALGSDDILWVQFWKYGGGTGGIKITLSNNPRYGLDWCGVDGTFPARLPDAVNKVWQFYKTPGQLRVVVNGEEVLNILTEGLCRFSHSPGVWNSEATSVMIPSSDTASDSYRFY